MTPLERTLKREVTIDGRAFIVAISPDGIKLTLKGKRIGQELKWKDLVSGEAALAVALNASLGGFAQPAAHRTSAAAPEPPAVSAPAPVAETAPKAAQKKAAQTARKKVQKKRSARPKR